VVPQKGQANAPVAGAGVFWAGGIDTVDAAAPEALEPVGAVNSAAQRGHFTGCPNRWDGTAHSWSQAGH
jgi:hypothetical protein